MAKKLGSITGNTVWNDLNNNGIQDTGEKGIGEVVVKLWGTGADGVEAVVATTTTTTNGKYSFTGVDVDSSYRIQVTSPAGYTASPVKQGADATVDSDFTNGFSSAFTIQKGANTLNLDAGLHQPLPVLATIGDYVWMETTGNGIQDSTEKGVEGVKVSLWLTSAYNTGAAAQQTAVTDKDGAYHFDVTKAGAYTLKFDGLDYIEDKISAGLPNVVWGPGATFSFGDPQDGSHGGITTTFTAAHRGTNTALDSDVDGSGLVAVKVKAGDHLTNIDAGLSISFWAVSSPLALDLDGNGIHTTALGATSGTFDLLANGTQVRSGWLSSGDAFLAVDANANGKIDSRAELFGGNKGEGFAQLAAYDTNHDGQVNANDADFGKLLVWQDANGNHATDAGELRTLAQAGIASLTVAYADQWVAQNGNYLGESSSATRADGSSISVVDAYFAYDSGPATAQLLAPGNALLDNAFGPGAHAAPAHGAHDGDSEALRRVAHAMQEHSARLAG